MTNLEVSYPPGGMDLYDAALAQYQHLITANMGSR